VLLSHLPLDSAVARAEGSSGLSYTEILLMDLWSAKTGKLHPAYPKNAKAVDPEHEKRVRSARVRARERQRAIDAGEII